VADVTDRADGIGVPGLILLIRGRAELDVVDGIPDEYLEASGTYEMTPEQRVDWEAEVRSLYDGMVRIVVTPTCCWMVHPTSRPGPELQGGGRSRTGGWIVSWGSTASGQKSRSCRPRTAMDDSS